MADKKDTTEEGGARRSRTATGKAAIASVRTRVAQVVWLLAVLAAVVLAAGALCIALGANEHNALVKFVLDTADKIDLGVFSRKHGVKHFTGHNADVKNALVNWGLGAVVYLVVGRILDRVIRP